MREDKLQEIIELLPYSIRYSGEIEELLDYAKEQAERAQELEETNKKNYWIAADFKFENLQLEQQNKRYREALNSIMTLWKYSEDRTDFEWLAHKMSDEARKALEGEE